VDKYHGHLAADYAKRLHDKELEAMALNFNSGKYDLKQIILNFAEEQYHEEIGALLAELETLEDVGPMTIMLE
jgi:hypothetical protein